MPKFSVDAMPEVFVSETAISKAVSAAVARGQLRKLASRLYTRNPDEGSAQLVLPRYILLSRCPDHRPDSP